MNAVLDKARQLLGRSTDVRARVEGLEAAVTAAKPFVDGAELEQAALVAERAGARLKLSGSHTVVALAGATGSGKSSTFNALSGLDLAAVGVRRPTTSWASSCVWGAEGADELMEWLGIPKRHQVARDSMLGTPGDHADQLKGLVLLDLPDHDSTEVSHHLEVDRLVALTDMLVWVLDPQKYADAAIHDRYLKPLASHADVMVVVLNHIDEVPEDNRPGLLADLRRLLAEDGLGEVPVFATSALHGLGIDELRAEVTRRVSTHSATQTRLMADVLTAAEALAETTGSHQPAALTRQRRSELTDALAEAAGVPVVVEAVQRSVLRRTTRATGWPVTAWLGRLRPDPLRRLHLDVGASARDLVSQARSSLPEANQIQQARVDQVVRQVAEDESRGLTRPWADAVRAASVSRLPDINDALDRAVTATDLRVKRMPLWTNLVRSVQWLLILTALGGAGWLGTLAVMGYLQLPQPSTPRVLGFPVPTLMLLGGVVAGIVLALASRLLVSFAARSRARSADHRLRAAVSGVAERVVLDPIEETLEAYRKTREGLSRALL